MKKLLGLLFVCILVLGAGCVGMQPVPSGTTQMSPTALAERYRVKALKYENAEEYQKALLAWEVVKGLKPKDREANTRIAKLREEFQKKADRHFSEGVNLYRRRYLDKARKEFLIALRYAPDHSEALQYLKQTPPGLDFKTYTVAQGDSLKKIAKKFYGDSKQGFLIAYFNDLGAQDKLAPGTTLELPILDVRLKRRLAGLPIYRPQPVTSGATSASTTPTEPTEPTEPAEPAEIEVDVEGELNKAKELFQARKYSAAIPIAEKILEADPGNAEAAKLRDDAAFRIGKDLSRQKKYVEALQMYNKVSSGYPGLDQAISSVKTIMDKQAEVHYRRGVKYYVNEKLVEAIKEWTQTLKFNPAHPKAIKDIENARSLLEKLKGTK